MPNVRKGNRVSERLQERNKLLAEVVGIAEAPAYSWVQDSTGIYSYRHKETLRHVHFDARGQFYNEKREPIEPGPALHHARGEGLTSRSPMVEEQQIAPSQRLSQEWRAALHSIEEVGLPEGQYYQYKAAGLPESARVYAWKENVNGVDRFQNVETGHSLRTDPDGNFYNAAHTQISGEEAIIRGHGGEKAWERHVEKYLSHEQGMRS